MILKEIINTIGEKITLVLIAIGGVCVLGLFVCMLISIGTGENWVKRIFDNAIFVSEPKQLSHTKSNYEAKTDKDHPESNKVQEEQLFSDTVVPEPEETPHAEEDKNYVEESSPDPARGYYVIIGSFKLRDNAYGLASKLSDEYPDIQIVFSNGWYYATAGGFSDNESEAGAKRTSIRQKWDNISRAKKQKYGISTTTSEQINYRVLLNGN